MRFGRRIFSAIELVEKCGGGSGGGGGDNGGGVIAMATFIEFFLVFDLDFNFHWFSSQHFCW